MLMKKSTILVCLLAILFFSCKKDKEGNSYYLTVSIDGVKKEFNSNAFAGLITVPDGQGFALGGFENEDNATSPSFAFEISNHPSGKPITKGVYLDSSTDFEMLSSYMINENLPLYEAGATLYQESIRDNKPIANHLRVEITAIGNGSVRGTISGDYHLDANPAGAKKVITNGEFYLPLITTP